MQTMFSRFAEVLKVEESRTVSETQSPEEGEAVIAQSVQTDSGLKAELHGLVETLSKRNDVRVLLTTSGLE